MKKSVIFYVCMHNKLADVIDTIFKIEAGTKSEANRCASALNSHGIFRVGETYIEEELSRSHLEWYGMFRSASFISSYMFGPEDAHTHADWVARSADVRNTLRKEKR